MPDVLVMLPEWRNGNVWPVIHFRFHLLRLLGHWLHGRKMETVQREALPNTMIFSVVQWPFLAGNKDSQRNLCPQALVLQLTSPSVLQTLLLLGCTVAWSSKPPGWEETNQPELGTSWQLSWWSPDHHFSMATQTHFGITERETNSTVKLWGNSYRWGMGWAPFQPTHPVWFTHACDPHVNNSAHWHWPRSANCRMCF